MSGALRVGILAVLALVAFLAATSLFIVRQTHQALVLRFGAVKQVIQKPGLNFKVPFIETVVMIDRRLLDLDLPVQQILTADRQNLDVDAFARYRITNPLTFYQVVNNERNANDRLISFTNAAMRNVLAGSQMSSIVRTERLALMNRIQDDVNRQAQGLGIEIVDVRLTRVDLPANNRKSVYDQMAQERKNESANLRAQGQELAQGIRARADRDVAVLLGEATRKADELRGAGDAERNRVFAEAFNRDPDFFSFYRSMQAYEAGLKQGDTRMILSPDSDFFRFFNDAAGRKPAAKAP